MNRSTLQRRPAPFPAWPLATFLLAASAAPAVQATDFATRDQYAWSENAGWFNLKDNFGNAQVYSDHLEGYAWAENVGWVRFASYKVAAHPCGPGVAYTTGQWQQFAVPCEPSPATIASVLGNSPTANLPEASYSTS